MVTRGLIGYILRNKQRKAMYNRFDSYPKCQGYGIALFISRLSHEQAKEMADLVENIEWIENVTEDVPKDIQKRYLAFDGIWRHQHPYGGPEHWCHEWDLSGKENSEHIEEQIEEAKKMLEGLPSKEGYEVVRDNMRRKSYIYEDVNLWYGLLVEAQLGYRALRFIQEGKLKHLIDFMGDTELQSEWEYYIDFGHEKMEVWGPRGLVREVTFDTLREDPEYMCKADFSRPHGEKKRNKRRTKTSKPRSHY
ncbi:hypothetical protein L202_01815 [Cryptococcus amylolentus CBS 6039]|uniref:Uncharacterized protein n=1 Tax=Cryptococcus amylolentus CBS 6039 TaxID=1295533 RepID=A0A1E3I7E0_9TREE|nr:hypothetical protein L202_01815 [Cryptococcus amylolentus CBS 6039]ODN83721.1 hypothetical protein L202_01815 [Cryptococcus amylolentus CBS 6039]